MRVAFGFAILGLVLAACGVQVLPLAPVPDGELVDGIWVGERADCTALDCGAITACALERADDRRAIVGSAVFRRPDRLTDGTLLSSGGSASIVVFDLADGSRDAHYVFSSDGC